MRKFFRPNTVFYKLVASYSVLIVLSIAAQGICAYLIFSGSFNEQIEKVNIRMLHHLSDMIDREAIRKTEQLYVDITMDQQRNSDLLSLFDQPLTGNHSKLLNVHQYLSQLALSNDEFVDSIELYYRYSGAMVSSGPRGYVQLNEDQASGSGWMNRMAQSGSNTLWLREAVADASDSTGPQTDTLIFIRAYPFTAKADKAKGFISIRLKPDAILRYLEPEGATDKSSFLLLDKNGDVMEQSMGDSRLTGEHLKELAERLRHMPEKEGNFLGDYGAKVITSYTTLGESGWKLVNLTLVDQYYQKSIAIRNTFLLISLAAVSIGFILSNIVTLRIYNPIKRLVRGIRTSLHAAIPFLAEERGENELQTIDRVISHLTLKVTELEQTFADNMPLIKHHLVTGLMQRSITGEDEYKDMLRLLGASWSGSFHSAWIIRLDPVYMSGLSAENSQFIQYSLLHQIEEHASDGLSLLTTALPNHQIGVILAASSDDTQRLQRLARQVIEYIRDSHMLPAVIAYGSWETSPLDLHKSYSQAQTALSYHYFLPDSSILSGPEMMKRELSSAEIEPDTVGEFSRLLKSGSLQSVTAFIQDWKRQLQSGPYSAEHGHQRIRELVGEFRSYLRELHIRNADIFSPDSWEAFRQIHNIGQMEEWLLSSVRGVFHFLENRPQARGDEMISELRQYVQSSYPTDISLESAAEHVSLSPRYLSRIFKDETGMNFTDYVTKTRLEKAMELILNTDGTIEQISRQVGFNSSGYFIKKFKTQYGVTPKMYKELHSGHPHDIGESE